VYLAFARRPAAVSKNCDVECAAVLPKPLRKSKLSARAFRQRYIAPKNLGGRGAVLYFVQANTSGAPAAAGVAAGVA
jgi:hypothetical protein